MFALYTPRASLRDEPLDDLEGEQEEGREEGRSAEEGRGNVHGVGTIRTRHRGFVAGDDSLEQSCENEELEGEKHQRMGKEKVNDT